MDTTNNTVVIQHISKNLNGSNARQGDIIHTSWQLGCWNVDIVVLVSIETWSSYSAHTM